MSHKASKITRAVSGGLDAAASATSSIPIVGSAIGGVSALFKMIKGAVGYKRENDRSITSRLAKKEYDPTQDNVGYSFGNSTTSVPTSQPMFGGQAKYGMPLYGNGGNPIKYDSNFRPATSYEQKYNKETGLWEVSGAKPKSTPVKQTTKSNKVEPIYVDNPKDKRLQAYNDSLNLFNKSKINDKLMSSGEYSPSEWLDYINGKINIEGNNGLSLSKSWEALKKYNGIGPTPIKVNSYLNDDIHVNMFKKPVQPVILKKEVKVPVPKVNYLKNLPTEQDSKIDILGNNVQYQNEPTQETTKGKPLNDFLIQTVKTPNGMKIYKRKDTNSPFIEQYALGGFINKNKINNSLSNGMFSPDGKFFFSPEQYQQYQSFYNPQPQLQQPIMNNYGTLKMKSNFKNNSFFELGGDPNIDNILKTNSNLDWVKRLYEKNTPSIILEGQSQPSTHYMESSDNLVYPTIVRNADGKLEYLGDKARDYAIKTNTAIKLANEKDAAWFGENYKKGTGVLKEFDLGGDPRAQSDIEAEEGEAMQHSSGKIENIEGEKHENGGTPLQVQPSHEYIYSDSLGYDKQGNITLNEKDVKKSFADKAKSIQKKYSAREGDSIVDKTKEIELGLLKQDAEQARVAKEEIEMGKQMKKYKAKYGANLKRFDNSGNPQPSSIMTPEEMKALYEQLNLQAKGVSSGLNNTIGEMKQTSQQLDANTQRLQQMSNPQINAPLYNLSSKYDGDSQTEPITLKTPWGTYDRSGNLKNNINPITPIGPKKLNIENTQVGITNTPQPLFGGDNRINPFVGPRVPSRRATPSIDQRSTASEVADKIKNGMFSSLTTGDKMQLASMLPAFGFNLGMGLRKADVEPNRKNLYEKDVVNIMQNRKFDIQNYLNQSNLATNTAKEDIGNNSTSVGGKMANIQKLYANSLNSLGDITTKGQEMNNQYRAEEANTKNILGEANRAESIRAAGINDQNKARKQQFLAKAFEQMGQGIATTGQSANQSLTNKLLIKSLSEISPDFDVKNMKDLQVGDDGYIVFKGVKTEFKMSNEGKIVMAGGTPNTANAAKSQYAPKDFTMKAFANFTKTKTKG